MKKIFSITALILAVTVFLPTYICEAKDVWVSHWNSENIDVYVMDDTLRRFLRYRKALQSIDKRDINQFPDQNKGNSAITVPLVVPLLPSQPLLIQMHEPRSTIGERKKFFVEFLECTLRINIHKLLGIIRLCQILKHYAVIDLARQSMMRRVDLLILDRLACPSLHDS